jgi:hypothetical protein
VTQRVKELSQIKNNIMELELVVTTGKGGDARQKMFQGYDSSAYRPAEETEETMYSSNRDILQQQVQEIDTQDKALGNISRGLGNLKMMSQDMNKELTLQSGLLDDIEQGVDRTDAHLKSNIKRVNLVDEESDGGCCTCLLMFGLFALIVFLLTTNYACYIFNPKKC